MTFVDCVHVVEYQLLSFTLFCRKRWRGSLLRKMAISSAICILGEVILIVVVMMLIMTIVVMIVIAVSFRGVTREQARKYR